MNDTIITGYTSMEGKMRMSNMLNNLTKDISPNSSIIILSPTEDVVKYYIEKYNISNFDFDIATYGLNSNVKIECNTKTNECKITIFNNGENIASYNGYEKIN